MEQDKSPRDVLVEKVVAYAAQGGIAGRSLREIAAGVGSSHRMLLYHFGSREGLMAAVVQFIEGEQRTAMASLATDHADDASEAMRALWRQLASEDVRPFVRLFFEVFGMAVQGTPGATSMLDNLTGSWLDEAGAVSEQYGYPVDRRTIRLGVAVARGLLIDLLAGADPDEVSAAHELFIDMVESVSWGGM